MQIRNLVGPLVFLVVAVCPSESWPDQVKAPHPYVKVSLDGSYYFKMVPDNEREGIGTAFKVTSGATDKPLWSVSGWFGFRTFLSENGRYLVRMGPWPEGREPSDEHLAIAFYDNGTLIAQYSTKELIKDPTAIRPSSGHYAYWNAGLPYGFIRPEGLVGFFHWFHFITSDGIRYVFDRRDGRIVSQEPYDE